MKQSLLFILSLFCLTANAQMGVGTITPDASAQVHMNSVTKGLLMPRMTASEKSDIVSPATGLLVFQTDGASGFYFYNGSVWSLLTIQAAGLENGDTKYSWIATNHEGWYLLNGQATSTLPAAAQATAAVLGIGVNLPDTRDMIAKNRAASGESIGSDVASNSLTLTRANLPNVLLSAALAGAHGHSYTDAFWSSNMAGNSGMLGANAAEDTDNNKASTGETTSTTGAHTHTTNLNGNVAQTAIDTRQASFNLNQFIYLGN